MLRGLMRMSFEPVAPAPTPPPARTTPVRNHRCQQAERTFPPSRLRTRQVVRPAARARGFECFSVEDRNRLNGSAIGEASIAARSKDARCIVGGHDRSGCKMRTRPAVEESAS